VRLISFLALLPSEFSDAATKESSLRENCTSLLTERMEEGLRLDLLRLYSERERATEKGKRPAGVESFERNIHTRGGYRPLCKEREHQSCKQCSNEQQRKLDASHVTR